MSAFATLTVQDLSKFNEFATAGTYTSITTALATNGASPATYGAAFAATGADNKYLILVHNTNSTDEADPIVATIKAGNGLLGNGDITISLENGMYSYVTVESGRFKNVAENDTLKALSSDTDATKIGAKGNVFITSTSSYIKVAVFKLP